MIRWTILRSLPGREVVIRLETGELQTFFAGLPMAAAGNGVVFRFE